MVRRPWLTVASLLLVGCSGIKSYPDNGPHNLTLNTVIESGSRFSSVRASLEVYDIDPQCQLHYLGTVRLDRATTGIGVATGRPSYLTFLFDSSGLFSRRSSSISTEMVVTPRTGYQYTATVNYRDDIYHVELEERPPHGKRRTLNLPGLGSCQATN